jgi:drug/metabolite transporter (DMT)-like permease
MMSTPLLITIISLFVLKERMSLKKALGLALGIGGATLLMSAGKEITVTGNSALGDLLIFLNAASYAVYLVIIKPLMVRYRPIIVIRWVFLFGFLFTLPFSLPQFLAIKWTLFGWGDYLAVAFIVVCVTFFTYLWNVYALQHLSPATAGAYIYLQPIFAAIISILVTGEELTWVKLVATLLIFSGVYFVNFGFRRKGVGS